MLESVRAGSSSLHLESVHTLSFKGAATAVPAPADGATAAAGAGNGSSSSNPALCFRVAVHERVPSGADTGTGLPHYAVVRVRDKRKHEIGQSVLCLRDALPRPAGQRRGSGADDKDGDNEGAEEERGAFLEASVCDGGRLVGRLLLRAEVLTEEEERRRRKKELQQRVGFLASATATIRGLAHGIRGGK